jgi:hypothetical protein
MDLSESERLSSSHNTIMNFVLNFMFTLYTSMYFFGNRDAYVYMAAHKC